MPSVGSVPHAEGEAAHAYDRGMLVMQLQHQEKVHFMVRPLQPPCLQPPCTPCCSRHRAPPQHKTLQRALGSLLHGKVARRMFSFIRNSTCTNYS